MECIARKIEFVEQKLDMDKLRTDFGYRVKDIFTQMTDSNIKKYRVEQLKMLALSSRQLQDHFQQSEKDKLLMKRQNISKSKSLMRIPQYLQVAAEQIKQNCSLVIDVQQGTASKSYAKRTLEARMREKQGAK